MSDTRPISDEHQHPVESTAEVHRVIHREKRDIIVIFHILLYNIIITSFFANIRVYFMLFIKKSKVLSRKLQIWGGIFQSHHR